MDDQHATVYLIAFLVGTLYALGVSWWRRQFGDSGQAALWTVLGSGMVTIFFAILWGKEAAWDLLTLYVLTGLPQIVRYQWDTVNRDEGRF